MLFTHLHYNAIARSKGVGFNKATDQYLGFFHQQPLEDCPEEKSTNKT